MDCTGRQRSQLVTLLGLPGTGKTTVAGALSRLLPHAVVLPEPSLPTLVHEAADLRSPYERPSDNLNRALGFALAEFELALGWPRPRHGLTIRDRGVEDQLYVIDRLCDRQLLPPSARDLLRDARLLWADLPLLLTADLDTRRTRLTHRRDDRWASHAIRAYERTLGAGYNEWMRERVGPVAEVSTSALTPSQVAERVQQRLETAGCKTARP